MWADSGRASALTLGAPIALVVELGARDAEVTAGASLFYKIKVCNDSSSSALRVVSNRARRYLKIFCGWISGSGLGGNCSVRFDFCAVIHGCPVIPAMQSQPLGARAIHDELSRILDEDNGTELHLSDEELEDIKGAYPLE